MNNSITKKTAQTLPMPAKTKWNVLSNIKTICDSIVESGLSPERTTPNMLCLLSRIKIRQDHSAIYHSNILGS